MATREKKAKIENKQSLIVTTDVGGKKVSVGFINLNTNVSDVIIEGIADGSINPLEWLSKFEVSVFEEKDSYEGSIS